MHITNSNEKINTKGRDVFIFTVFSLGLIQKSVLSVECHSNSLHFPKLFHPLIFGYFSLEQFPPPLFHHESERQRANNGQGLLQEKIDVNF